ncbi:Bax inhibitor-1/YccA family protein [Agrobacterium sp. BA1120]|uniref:Bax inhibitor-1/YccA family protein n=1 Tax=Agrobacterium sp. BA1120 TaxID=3228927 RepID=UPI000DDF88B0
MSDFNNYQNRMAQGHAQSGAMIDQGLRTYMLKVYNLMALALVITGVASFFTYTMAVSNPAFAQLLYGSPLKWVVMFAPLGLVLFLSFRIQNMSVPAAQATFWGYAALMGISLSSIFLVYTGQSIVQTFFITAASFGALSLYGYTTKKDLSGMGSFLIMGLFGLIIASLVNIFLQSSAMGFAISAIGVLIFAGLTAYDTQKIKEMYFDGDDVATAGRKAIMGALTLYLDFINLFMFLLQFLGNRDK